MAKAILQHARNLVVRQAVGGFHINARFHTTALLTGAHAQQAIGIHGEGHADACRSCCHGRDSTQLEARETAAVLHQVAFALYHMDRQRGLAVFVGGEILCLGRGNGLVASHNALHQAAHGFDAQRQRNHIQQQQVARGAVACQLVGLNGGAQRHNLVRVQVGQRLLAKELRHRALHLGHAGRATHHHHTLHLVTREVGVAQRAAHGSHGACRQAQRSRLRSLIS